MLYVIKLFISLVISFFIIFLIIRLKMKLDNLILYVYENSFIFVLIYFVEKKKFFWKGKIF